jgi:succinate dehydrogenase/fumarate reductase flavoprotein subunit
LYPGGSNIPEAIAFGRIAGENAAAEKPLSDSPGVVVAHKKSRKNREGALLFS